MMKKFNPQISVRSTEELIQIVHIEGWQPEAIMQAKEELLKRNISIQEQEKFIDDCNLEYENQLFESNLKFERNKNESYKPWEIFLIFLFAPYLLTNRYYKSLTLFELYKQNYKLKFKQRLIVLLLSLCFYAACIFYYINWKEEQWLKEIDEIEISE